MDFAGALAATFAFALHAFFPFFGLVIVAFLSILPSDGIVKLFSDCMVIVGSIEVWFRKPSQKPPEKLRNSDSHGVHFPFDY